MLAQSPLARSALDLSARVLLTCAFWWSGVVKLTHFDAAVDETSALGVPWPALAAAATIVVQLVGSALVIADRGAWLGAGALAGFTLIATLLAHPFWSAAGGAAGRNLMTFLEHLGLIGGFLLVMRHAGRSSPDRAMDRAR